MAARTTSRATIAQAGRGFLRADLLAWVQPSVIVGVVLQALFLIVAAATDSFDSASHGEPLRIVLTFATAIALFGLVPVAVGRRRVVGFAATMTTVMLFVLVNVAHQVTMGAFDYGFVHDNVKDAFTKLGFHIMTSDVKPASFALLVLLPIAAGVALRKLPSRPWPGSRSVRVGALLACGGLLVGLPLMRKPTHEALTAFIASGVRFHAESVETDAFAGSVHYPYVHETGQSPRAGAIAGDAKQPNVILLFMESFNGNFVGQRRADGRPYTPVFDKRRDEGLTVDHFYGNSVQSSRGHFATLCSLPPVYRGKEFTDLASDRFHCLPEVLREAGYGTVFVSATAEAEFEDAQHFFEKIGFEEAVFQEKDPKKRGPEFWGTGVEDDVFYPKFFAEIDERLAKGKPVFAVAANASNHYPFNENPKHVPDPGERTQARRDYAASLGTSDQWLEGFFAEIEKRPALRDAIVVVVGDHSFPVDEHGNHFNGLTAYEEVFRTGFMLRWPGHIQPERLTNRGRLAARHRAHHHRSGRDPRQDPVRGPVPLLGCAPSPGPPRPALRRRPIGGVEMAHEARPSRVGGGGHAIRSLPRSRRAEGRRRPERGLCPRARHGNWAPPGEPCDPQRRSGLAALRDLV